MSTPGGADCTGSIVSVKEALSQTFDRDPDQDSLDSDGFYEDDLICHLPHRHGDTHSPQRHDNLTQRDDDSFVCADGDGADAITRSERPDLLMSGMSREPVDDAFPVPADECVDRPDVLDSGPDRPETAYRSLDDVPIVSGHRTPSPPTTPPAPAPVDPQRTFFVDLEELSAEPAAPPPAPRVRTDSVYLYIDLEQPAVGDVMSASYHGHTPQSRGGVTYTIPVTEQLPVRGAPPRLSSSQRRHRNRSLNCRADPADGQSTQTVVMQSVGGRTRVTAPLTDHRTVYTHAHADTHTSAARERSATSSQPAEELVRHQSPAARERAHHSPGKSRSPASPSSRARQSPTAAVRRRVVDTESSVRCAGPTRRVSDTLSMRTVTRRTNNTPPAAPVVAVGAGGNSSSTAARHSHMSPTAVQRRTDNTPTATGTATRRTDNTPTATGTATRRTNNTPTATGTVTRRSSNTPTGTVTRRTSSTPPSAAAESSQRTFLRAHSGRQSSRLPTHRAKTHTNTQTPPTNTQTPPTAGRTASTSRANAQTSAANSQSTMTDRAHATSPASSDNASDMSSCISTANHRQTGGWCRGSDAVHELTNDLINMLSDPAHADVTIEVDGRQLTAHRCILSARCQYFRDVLQKPHNNHIHIDGHCMDTVQFVLHHLYSGAVDIPDQLDLCDLLTFSVKLGHRRLTQVTELAMRTRLCHMFHKPCETCIGGVLETLSCAVDCGREELSARCLSWIRQHRVSVWTNSTVKQMDQHFCSWCFHNTTSLSEETVVDIMVDCGELLCCGELPRWMVDSVEKLASNAVVLASRCLDKTLTSDKFMLLCETSVGDQLKRYLLAAADIQNSADAMNCVEILNQLNCIPNHSWHREFVALLENIKDVCLRRSSAGQGYTSVNIKRAQDTRGATAADATVPPSIRSAAGGSPYLQRKRLLGLDRGQVRRVSAGPMTQSAVLLTDNNGDNGSGMNRSESFTIYKHN